MPKPDGRKLTPEESRRRLFPVLPEQYSLAPGEGFDALRLVVAGLPRSGTTWLSNVFQGLGVKAGHERLFSPSEGEDLRRRKGFVVDVSGFVHPYLEALRKAEIPVVHLLRHPIHNLTSILNYFPSQFPPSYRSRGWQYLCKYYCDNHKRLDDYSCATIYLERLSPGEVKNLLAMVGESRPLSQIEQAMRGASRGRSTPESRFLWADMPDELQEYAIHHKYGP